MSDHDHHSSKIADKDFDALTDAEWEALCDRCGLCCLEKVQDDDFIYYTRVACHLLDHKTISCQGYKDRQKTVSDCIKITKDNIKEIDWLPKACAYVLRFEDKPLPIWHPLIDKTGKHAHLHPRNVLLNQTLLIEEEIPKSLGLENFLLEDVDLD